jgi:hypothetical protein
MSAFPCLFAGVGGRDQAAYEIQSVTEAFKSMPSAAQDASRQANGITRDTSRRTRDGVVVKAVKEAAMRCLVRPAPDNIHFAHIRRLTLRRLRKS